MVNIGVLSTATGSSDDGAVDRIIDAAQQSLEDALVNLAELLPKIILAIVVVYGAVRISRRLDPYIQTAASYVDRKITSSFTQDAFPNVPAELIVSRIVGAIVVFYSVFIASTILEFSELQRELERILFYLPDLFGGLAIVLLALGIGRIAGQRTVTGPLAADTDYATEIAIVVKTSIVTIGVLVGLEMVGVDLQLVYILADGFAGAIGLGLTAALAILVGVVAGIALQNSDFLQQDS